MNRLFVFESESSVKQAAAHPHGNGQSVGVEGFAQNAAAGGREFVVAVLVFATLGEKLDAGGQRAEQVFQLLGTLRGNVEGTHNGKRLLRRNDACLMFSVAGISLGRVLAFGGAFGGFALPLPAEITSDCTNRAGCDCGFKEGAPGRLCRVVRTHVFILCLNSVSDTAERGERKPPPFPMPSGCADKTSDGICRQMPSERLRLISNRVCREVGQGLRQAR